MMFIEYRKQLKTLFFNITQLVSAQSIRRISY